MPQVALAQANYYAPRGRDRLQYLGHLIALRYLEKGDRLIGVMGEAGAGKSVLVRGMFPDLPLTNDDEGINIRPLPLLEHAQEDNFTDTAYHVDLRFEGAFAPLPALAEAAQKCIMSGRRVVAEHFELIADMLPFHAGLLVGIGEEVAVARPTRFGPSATEIARGAAASLHYRRMAHTAEDLTGLVLERMNIEPVGHGDVRRGFILEFSTKPPAPPAEVEAEVRRLIRADLPVCYGDDRHIRIGGTAVSCSGPRLHLMRTGDINGFALLSQWLFDPMTGRWDLVAQVGEDATGRLRHLESGLKAD